MFPASSSADFLVCVMASCSAKGKVFRASLPNCSDDENDREVVRILDKSPPKRSVREAEITDHDSQNDDKTKYTKRRETSPSTPTRSTKSANAIGDSPCSKKPKIDTSKFRHFDRLLTREEREYLSCKDKGIYNTKKKKITKEVEKRWPPKNGCKLPNYRIKTDAEVVDEFVNKLAEDKAVLFPEFGLKKGAILEVVLKKFREQRRQQKDTISLATHDDSATETPSTESASESSSSSSSPPLSQLHRVKKYNLYFHEDMTQSSADLILMVFLGKLSLKDVKMDNLHKLRKLFHLGLLRGKDKATHIRAIASALYSEGYISIPEESNLASLARSDIKVIKSLDGDGEDKN